MCFGSVCILFWLKWENANRSAVNILVCSVRNVMSVRVLICTQEKGLQSVYEHIHIYIYIKPSSGVK